MALLGSDSVGVAAALGSLSSGSLYSGDALGSLVSGDDGLGALPEPPGHIVSVKSDWSLQTVVRTSSGWL